MDVLRQCNVNESGRGRRPIVFAHGFGTDQRAWRFVAPAFEDDWRVVRFDHMGCGRSDLRAYDDRRYASLDGYAADVVDILDSLGLSDVTYVGHSAGGVIGMLASLARPGAIGRLVLVGTSPRFTDDPPYVGGFGEADIEGILDLIEVDQGAWADAVAPMAMGDEAEPALVNDFGAGLRSLDPLVASRFARLVFTVDCRERIPEIAVPTLVLQCLHDSLVPAGVGRWMHDRIERSSLVEIDGSGHCPHLTHPDATVAAIRAFLSDADVIGG